ncbi:MAG: 2-phospho-L-lactate guanylyltransferase [Thermoplasmata archaeon]
MRAVAAIILRSFHETKPKLASVLNVGERRALTKAMFEDVVSAALGCSELSHIAVISPEEEVLGRARDRGLVAIKEKEFGGMDRAFQVGAKFCTEKAGEVLMCLPSDLPLVTPKDLSYLLGRIRRGPKAVVVPSTIGPGTSILLASPPDVIEPRFEEDNHLAHLEEAERKGVPAEVCELLQAGLDVDTPKDLARLFLVERPCETRDLLEDMDILGRLRPFF